jgi:hypothetical protein
MLDFPATNQKLAAGSTHNQTHSQRSPGRHMFSFGLFNESNDR